MADFIQGAQQRKLLLGHSPVVSANYSLVTETHTSFTVAGGEALITALWLKVTTTMTVANTVKLQLHPTAGNTADLVTATDLGTTDSAVGTVAGLGVGTTGTSPAAPKLLIGGKVDIMALVTTGTLEQVTTGTSPDGACQWYLTYIPLTTGATIVAA